MVGIQHFTGDGVTGGCNCIVTRTMGLVATEVSRGGGGSGGGGGGGGGG